MVLISAVNKALMAEAVKAKITYGLMYVLRANLRLELKLKSVIDIPSVRRSSGKMNEKITILIAGGISGTDPAIRIRTDIPLQMPVQAGIVVLLIFVVFILFAHNKKYARIVSQIQITLFVFVYRDGLAVVITLYNIASE